MSDLLRRCVSSIFGTRWVILIDHDGDRFVRRMYFRGGQAMANRYSHRPIRLLDNGAVRGVSYVHGWMPYYPAGPKKVPAFTKYAPDSEAQNG
jgi:hypothetical protein